MIEDGIFETLSATNRQTRIADGGLVRFEGTKAGSSLS